MTVLDTSPDELKEHIRNILDSKGVGAIELARIVSNKVREKYDQYLSDDLLCQDYASAHLDVPGALQCLGKMVNSNTVGGPTL